MRSSLAFLIAFAALSPAVAAPDDNAVTRGYGLALAAGDQVAPIRATTLDGKSAVVAWGAAKLTLVNFWATWCAPCRQEMPELQAIHAENTAAGLRVVGVVVQDRAAGDPIAKAANEARVRYEVLWGGPEVEAAWRGVSILPTTFLVDPGGKVVRKYVGTNADQMTALRKDIADYLAGRPLGDPYLPPSDPVPPPKP